MKEITGVAETVREILKHQRYSIDYFGLNRNTHEADSLAFKLRADVTHHLEDDAIPRPDALHYFDWAVRELLIPDVKSTGGCHTLLSSGHNKPRRAPPIDATIPKPARSGRRGVGPSTVAT